MMDRLQRSFGEQQRFAANASRELRTPLAVVKTMLDVTAADPHGQDIPRLVRRISETNQRGIDIVETLLALSALDQGAVDVLLPEADAAGIEFEADVAPCEVEGNAVLLHQIVMNLGQNAIRHNDEIVTVYLALRSTRPTPAVACSPSATPARSWTPRCCRC